MVFAYERRSQGDDDDDAVTRHKRNQVGIQRGFEEFRQTPTTLTQEFSFNSKNICMPYVSKISTRPLYYLR